MSAPESALDSRLQVIANRLNFLLGRLSSAAQFSPLEPLSNPSHALLVLYSTLSALGDLESVSRKVEAS